MDKYDEMKYNYIFYNISNDYLEPIFGEYRSYKNIRVFDKAFNFKNYFEEKIFFLHWSNKINAKLKLPLKRFWYTKMYGSEFDNNKPNCFIFYGGKYVSEDLGLINYIRSRNPKNKIVVWYGDLISKNKQHKFDFVSKNVDLVLSYDKKEAEYYGIRHIDFGYTSIQKHHKQTNFKYDVYFVGNAKDRYEDILSVYKKLNYKGLSCDFYISGVDKDKQYNSKGLNYISQMPYSENIKHIINSKCILEIKQRYSEAPTIRAMEATIYKRKLLTNCKDIRNVSYINKQESFLFENSSNIDIDFLKSEIDYSSFNLEQSNELSPISRIKFIESILEQEGSSGEIN